MLIRRAEYVFWLANSPIESIFVDIVTSDNEPVLNMHHNMECAPRLMDAYFNCGGEIMGGGEDIAVAINDVAAIQVYAKLDGGSEGSEVYLSGDMDRMPTANTLFANMTNGLGTVVRSLSGYVQILVEHAENHSVLYVATNSSTHAFLEIKNYALQKGPDPVPTAPDGLSQGAMIGIIVAAVSIAVSGATVGILLLVQRHRRKSYTQLDGGENATMQNGQGESVPIQQLQGESSPVQQNLDESTPIRMDQGETYQAATSTVPADF